jgi:hypothetical protein
MHATRERGKAFLHRRKLRSADHADDSRATHRAGENPRQVRRIREAEGDTGEIRSGRVPTGRYVDRLGKLRCDATRGILKLEAAGVFV